jgi:alkylation response protein AidB-like acyl-CoA dehydrogenase
MDFQPTSDQAMLADSVDRFGREVWPVAERPRLLAAAGQCASSDRWRAMADLGWLALPLSEAQGGLGGSAADIMTVAEGLGRHLIPDPFISVCVAAASLLGPGQSDILEAIAAGKTRVVLALGEPGMRFEHLHISTRAEKNGAAFVLTGEKTFVGDGADADWFIVPARTSGEVNAAGGISLFLVPKDAENLDVSRIRSADNHRHARLCLSGVTVPLDMVLGNIDGGAAPLSLAINRAILAHCAEAVGAMDALHDITLEYIKTRQQFGKPIGSFQVVQHRMVDIAIACEEARSITYRATLEADSGAVDNGRLISAAKARVGQTALFVGRQAVQLHGGVGTSEELVVSHYLRRLMMIDLSYGNADHHRERFAALAV